MEHPDSDPYTVLTNLFATSIHLSLAPLPSALIPPSSSPTSIQISHPHIGIPTRALHAAFTTARSSSDLAATQILLLACPEHTTAINTRKRALLLDSTPISVLRELQWLSWFLCSDFPKVNKSPTLWQHRRWVLLNFREKCGLRTKDELELVRKAGEKHPKNYYAWEYARWVFSFLANGEKELVKEVKKQREYATAHVSDIAAWMFLAWLLARVMKTMGEKGIGVMDETVREVGIFVRDVTRGHESVGSFLRVTLCKEGPLEPGVRKDIADGLYALYCEKQKTFPEALALWWIEGREYYKYCLALQEEKREKAKAART